jgi:N-acyl-D-aspartate/D-glutamate deacylase
MFYKILKLDFAVCNHSVKSLGFYILCTNSGILKVAYDFDNKTCVLDIFKNLRSSTRKWAVKIKILKKKSWKSQNFRLF